MGFCFSPPCKVSSIQEGARNYPDTLIESDIPVRDRECTDANFFKFLVLYLTFLVISVSAAGVRGDIRRLIHGYDDYGNLCGYQNDPIRGVNGSGIDFTAEKYLQIRKFCEREICRIERDCVKRCKKGYDTSIIPQCASNEKENTVEGPPSIFEITCLDLTLCWKEIAVLCFLSICLSGLILTVFRMFAIVVIWTVLILVSITCIASTILTWTVLSLKIQSLRNHEGPGYDQKKAEMTKWIVVTLFISLFTVMFFSMLFSFRNKMKLVAILFEEGGKCLESIPMLLLQPIVTHISVAILFCFVCLGFASLQTSGIAEVDSEGKVTFPVNKFFLFMRWMLLFAFLWLSQFLLASQNLVVAGAAASWYFTRIKSNMINPVWRSFCMVASHHLGSAALGSLILATVKLIRMIFKMFERNAESKNSLQVLIWNLVLCLLGCLGTFLKMMNKAAYVLIVLYGKPLCASAHRAFDCISSNPNHMASVFGINTFILTLTEFFTSVGVTFIGVALFTNFEGLQNFWIPVIVVFILSFLCCHCFISVYDMTIDTILLSFCVDLQVNDGLSKPYYMSRNLMTIVNQSRRNSTEMTPRNEESEA